MLLLLLMMIALCWPICLPLPLYRHPPFPPTMRLCLSWCSLSLSFSLSRSLSLPLTPPYLPLRLCLQQSGEQRQLQDRPAAQDGAVARAGNRVHQPLPCDVSSGVSGVAACHWRETGFLEGAGQPRLGGERGVGRGEWENGGWRMLRRRESARIEREDEMGFGIEGCEVAKGAEQVLSGVSTNACNSNRHG